MSGTTPAAGAPAVQPRSLVTQVHDEVRAAIASGRHAPGDAVGIADTAKRLGVSATPVREALARLAAQGVLEFHPNLGYRVPAMPTARAYTEWATARVIVESNALRFILGPIDPTLLDEAEALNERIRTTVFGDDADGIRAYSELNWAFHARLIALSRNAILADLHQRLYAAPQFARIFVGRGIPAQERIAAEHASILRRLRRGDREGAAQALQDHIVDSLERDARLADVSLSLARLVPARRARNHSSKRIKEENA